ncbi:MAG: hypothetical protein ACLFQS_08535 [Bacteroidales bacterium]
MEKTAKIQQAKKIMDDFLVRTGIKTSTGNVNNRYLWTDAFAVQSCFALKHLLSDDEYHQHAITLIDRVHHILGKFHEDDPRSGWISGLPEEEGEKYPTLGGLRIGKKLPERKEGEPFDENLEWERDGQYFHYLTRWFNALMTAHRETNNKKYAIWAAELIQAGEKFISNEGDTLRMYWKMNTELTGPIVRSMGAHDPLEGLLCLLKAKKELPSHATALEPLEKKFIKLCRGMTWYTSDPLGIGSLLLNTARAAALHLADAGLTPTTEAKYLLSDSIKGLQMIHNEDYYANNSAGGRLPFRECGLSLGLNVLYGQRHAYQEKVGLNFQKLEDYLPISETVEDFWLKPSNQKASTWIDHLNINAVTLASSILGEHKPEVFV